MLDNKRFLVGVGLLRFARHAIPRTERAIPRVVACLECGDSGNHMRRVFHALELAVKINNRAQNVGQCLAPQDGPPGKV
jgi:hypothetical protein